MNKCNNWLFNPDYVKLLEFLVEKTKNVKEILTVRELVKEFMKNNKLGLKTKCLESRIKRFRRIIHIIPNLDTETRVKLLFGLTASVDSEFLRELRKDAEVKVDIRNRITDYKANGGGLELKANYKLLRKPAEVSNDQILEFISGKMEKKHGILQIVELCKEFQAATGNSQKKNTIERRFREATKQIYESKLFDENMKVKMMFATNAVVPDHVVEKLRKTAIVVVDETNRIIEYRNNDGSLNLTKGITEGVVSHKKGKNPVADETVDSEDSNDSEEEEEEKVKVTTRSGRLSKTNFSEGFFYENQKERSKNSSGSDSNTSISSRKKRKLLDHMTGSGGEKKPVIGRGIKEERDNNYSFENSYQYNNSTEVKLESFNGRLADDTSRGNIIDNGGDVVEETSIQKLVAPKQEQCLKSMIGKGIKEERDHDYCFDDSYQPDYEEQRAKLELFDGPLKMDLTRGAVIDDGDDFVEEIPAPIQNFKIGRGIKEEYDHDYCLDVSYQYDNEQRVKLEPFNGPLNDGTTSGNIINDGVEFVEEIPAPIENFVVPKQEELPMDIKMEEPDYIDIDMESEIHQNPSENVAILQNTITDVPEDSKELTLILGALNDFIDILGSPILSDLQKNIGTKLEECKVRKEIISNNEINLSLKLCFAKVTKIHQSSENNESMSLKEFLCYLNYSVKTMKCPYLFEFQEKLKKTIDELRVQDKTVPLTTIRGALQNTIDNLITC